MSSPKTAWICSSGAALAMAALATTGCGSSATGDVGKAAARLECAVAGRNAGAASFVRQAYAKGQLASRTQLRDQVFGNVPETSYLNADGTLKQLQTMSPQARRDFLAWIVRLDNDKKWQAEIDASQAAGLERAHCGS
jgi:hypothetical protein